VVEAPLGWEEESATMNDIPRTSEDHRSPATLKSFAVAHWSAAPSRSRRGLEGESKAEAQERAARAIQRLYRNWQMRNVALNRTNLIQRLQHENTVR
jgi:hypothetical protein